MKNNGQIIKVFFAKDLFTYFKFLNLIFFFTFILNSKNIYSCFRKLSTPASIKRKLSTLASIDKEQIDGLPNETAKITKKIIKNLEHPAFE